MLSRERALDYVTSTLGLKDVVRRQENDALGLVNDIIRKFICKVPFHNLHLMSLKVGDRKVPTVEENIESVLSGSGGLCWTLNSFMYCLLKALGYYTESLVALVHVPGAGSHMMTMLRHVVTRGDLYLVEVGGSPCFQAISLDFAKESETYQDSFLSYKYVKLENGLYVRKETSVRRIREERLTGTESEWRDGYSFNLDPVDLDRCKEKMRTIYITKTDGMFLTELRCVIFRDDRCVALKNYTILLEDADRILQPTQLTTPTEILSALREHFPEIRSDIALQAVQNWSKYCKDPAQRENTDTVI